MMKPHRSDCHVEPFDDQGKLSRDISNYTPVNNQRFLHCGRNHRQKGVALIIVLAFVVLLTGMAVAFLSRGANNRQVAQASFHDTDADLLARSALDIVVSDFRQELFNGSTNIGPAGAPFYSPAPATNVVPQRSGNPVFDSTTGTQAPLDPIPNLIRRSVRSDPILAPGIGSRASAVNSTTDVSANRRWVNLDRWNAHYLIPRADPGAAASVTTPRAEFVPPDWIIVTRNGPVAFSAWDDSLKDSTLVNNNYVVGRYAYAVYDEGGLLDINVAGFPTPSSNPLAWTTDIGRKSVLAFADLTTLRATLANPPGPMTTTAINKVILFRNSATTAIGGSTPTSLGTTTTFTASQASNFSTYYLGPAGVAGGTTDHVGTTTQDFGAVRQTSTGLGTSTRTDQNFITRAELIAFFNSGSSPPQNINALQYLGTFSREKNIATWRANGTTNNNIEKELNSGRFYMGQMDSLVPGATGMQSQFGIKWNGTNWKYNGPTGDNALSHIPAFTGNNRHFFQLIEYARTGISDGSDTVAQFLATLAFGASLIDQFDASGTATTRIDYGGGTVYGVKPSDPGSSQPSWLPTKPFGYVELHRPFRSVGDLGYGVAQISVNPSETLDFSIAASIDAPLLDLFTYNNAPVRSGIVSLNTRQYPVLAAILKGAITSESNPVTLGTVGGTSTDPNNVAKTIVNATSYQAVPAPALSRADIVGLASLVTSSPFNPGSEEVRETIPRALSECVQTRTWGLLIDLIAQTGHYSANATDLPQFIVEGEKHYWLHIAIDRFDGSIVSQQLEEVAE